MDEQTIGERAVQWFFRLSKTTAPYPHDTDWFADMIEAYNLDELYRVGENFIGYVDGAGVRDTVFVAHMDTADFEPTPIDMFVTDDGYALTTGGSILGADNRAGMAILLTMMEERVPGTYLFVAGEEVGRIGSKKIREEGWLEGYSRAIQFDRFGTTSIITHQMGERGCSEEFSKALAEALNSRGDFKYEDDDGGSFTDTYSFFSIIPECTNISVGFRNEHSKDESLDLMHLAKLAEAAVSLPWSELPTVQSTLERETLWDFYTPTKDKKSRDWMTGIGMGGYADPRKLAEEASKLTQWKDMYSFTYDRPDLAADLLMYLLDELHYYAEVKEDTDGR